jgi:RHS repeat-associated protein
VKGAVTSNYTRMKSAFANIGQLTVVDSSSNAEDRGYKYDAAWNLSMRTNNMTLETYTVDGKNQVVSSPESSGHYYDGNGNPVYKDMAADYIYAFDQENRLIAIEFSYWYMLSCGYDGQGRLRTMTTWEWSWEFEDYVTGGTVSYIYDGMRVIQERYLDSNTPEVSYTRGTDLSGSLEGAGGIGGMLARSAHTGTARTNHTHAFYHADGNGNITYLQTSAQGLGASYRYDAYGNTVASSGSLANANTYRFSSKMVEPFTGLYYYGYRWYAPNLQRWLNRDPIFERGGINLYGFVLNDPISDIDSFGLRQKKVPSKNGCGAEGKLDIVPDNFGLWNFGPACDAHDICYGVCGNSREDCDSKWRSDMIDSCSHLLFWPNLYLQCVGTANLYYYSVRAMGKPAYEKAQKECCSK